MIERIPRSKNGQPHQRTTGMDSKNWTHAEVLGEMASSGEKCPPMASTKIGIPSTKPILSRKTMSRSSVSSSGGFGLNRLQRHPANRADAGMSLPYFGVHRAGINGARLLGVCETALERHSTFWAGARGVRYDAGTHRAEPLSDRTRACRITVTTFGRGRSNRIRIAHWVPLSLQRKPFGITAFLPDSPHFPALRRILEGKAP